MSSSGSPPNPRAPRKARPKISLKMQAIGFLSRREHSRQELRVKLLDAMRKREREEAALVAAADAAARELAEAPSTRASNGIDDAFAPPSPSPSPSAPLPSLRAGHEPDPARQSPEDVVDQLLDWLVAHSYLSDARFVESRVHAYARKQGAARIRHELERHGLTLEPDQASALRETEFARAQAIWQRKYGDVASDPQGRAKQARFLAGRGFASDVVRRIVGGAEEF